MNRANRFRSPSAAGQRERVVELQRPDPEPAPAQGRFRPLPKPAA